MKILVLIIGVMALSGVSAVAQERVLPTSREQVQLSFSPVVKQTAAAVVNIYTKRKVVDRSLSPIFSDPFFEQFFGNQSGMYGIPRERVVSSLGSGVIVRSDGLVVTNHHVISDAQDITAILADKREYDAAIVLCDQPSDLCLLQLKGIKEPLSYVKLEDSDELEVGDVVLAIGNPFGVGQTVTSGIVSAVARSAVDVSDYGFFIQTDAAINPGNSGGALVDMNGRLIGVPTAIYSRSGGSIGIGFAIPSNMVRVLIASQDHGGKLLRPWLGASYQPVTREVADAMKLSAPRGVLVNEIFDNGPAEEAGIRSGDVIVAMDGKAVDDVQGLRFRIATAQAGKAIMVKILRDSEEKNVEVNLTVPPDVPPRDVRTLKGLHPLDGIVVANLNPAVCSELNIPVQQEGVVLVEQRGRLHKGDVIEQVNGTAIRTTQQLQQVMQQRSASWRMTIRRGDERLQLVVMP